MKVLNGQVVTWRVPSAQYLVCCDCGLYHYVVIKNAKRSQVTLRFYRDDALTHKKRLHRKHRRGL